MKEFIVNIYGSVETQHDISEEEIAEKFDHLLNGIIDVKSKSFLSTCEIDIDNIEKVRTKKAEEREKDCKHHVTFEENMIKGSQYGSDWIRINNVIANMLQAFDLENEDPRIRAFCSQIALKIMQDKHQKVSKK